MDQAVARGVKRYTVRKQYDVGDTAPPKAAAPWVYTGALRENRASNPEG